MTTDTVATATTSILDAGSNNVDSGATTATTIEEKKRVKFSRERRREENRRNRPPPAPGFCAHFIPGKNRYCKFEVLPGSAFCHGHLPPAPAPVVAEGGEGKASSDVVVVDKYKRVICPIDVTHTVYEKDLRKHLKICPTALARNAMENKPYFVKNLNFGNSNSSRKDTASAADTAKALSAMTKEMFERLTAKVDRACAEPSIAKYISEENIETSILRPQCCEKFFEIADGNGKGQQDVWNLTFQTKHLVQQASMIGHLERLNLLSRDHTYIEMGAGKAYLSAMVYTVLEGESDHYLIDRENFRRKGERVVKLLHPEVKKEAPKAKTQQQRNQQQQQQQQQNMDAIDEEDQLQQHTTVTSNEANNGYGNGNGSSGDKKKKVGLMKRVLIDIGHLWLGGMQNELQDKRCVCISKHLCGVATDLTLRCLVNKKNPSDSNEFKPNFEGIAIALCCHHKCIWDDYINQDMFLRLGFTPQEFRFISLMSSWATCGGFGSGEESSSGDAAAAAAAKKPPAPQQQQHEDKKDEDQDYYSFVDKLDPDTRMKLGWRCKRLVDAGRLLFLVHNGFEPKLVKYVNEDVSLENLMMVAVPSTTAATTCSL